jgi:sec-independent protein translocase protein TatA
MVNFMLEGWEWIVIGVVAIVIILWGPSKIPEFAKALGRARGEFSGASKESKETASEPASPPVSQPNVIKNKDGTLLETAHKLDIPTDGKTREQISEEISLKAKLLAA